MRLRDSLVLRLYVPLLIAGAVLVLAFLDGCAPSADQSGAATDNAQVIVKDLQFRPPIVNVRQGGTVTWLNQDTTAHTSTSKDFNAEEPTSSPPTAWDSPVIDRGGTWSRQFDSPGEYPYACSIHPYIEGTVVVSP